MERPMQRLIKGAVAGLLASGPMSLAMWAMKQALPEPERYPLPPRLITEEVAARAEVRDDVSREEMDAVTAAAHLGYGAGMGALFGLLSRTIPAPGLLSGPLFGLAVWAGSYLGWLPALGILTPATRHPARRNLLMIAAHLVWGFSLAGIMRLAERDWTGKPVLKFCHHGWQSLRDR